MNFFKRYYFQLCDTLVSPSRCCYGPDEVKAVYTGNSNLFDTLQFQVYSKGISLAACLWKRKILKSDHNSKQICVIYMHTNTRALIDAKEVFIASELCDNVSIAAFDLPGCGKSEGCLSGTVYQDLELLIEWIQCLISPDVQIILWARGMSTAAAIEFTSTDRISQRNSTSNGKSPSCTVYAAVKAVVLDSPFKSIGDMVSDATAALSGRGYSLSQSIMEMCTKMVVRTMSQRLGGFNPLQVLPKSTSDYLYISSSAVNVQVKPIELVGKCRIPAFIMSALHDDYISSAHGKAISAGWAGPTMFRTFSGSHFGQRPDALATEAFTFIAAFLNAPITHSRATSLSTSPLSETESERPSEYGDSSSSQPYCCGEEKGARSLDEETFIAASEQESPFIFEVDDGVVEGHGLGEQERRPRSSSQLGLCSGIGGFYFHSLSRPGSSQSLQSISSMGNLLLTPVATSPSEEKNMS